MLCTCKVSYPNTHIINNNACARLNNTIIIKFSTNCLICFKDYNSQLWFRNVLDRFIAASWRLYSLLGNLSIIFYIWRQSLLTIFYDFWHCHSFIFNVFYFDLFVLYVFNLLSTRLITLFQLYRPNVLLKWHCSMLHLDVQFWNKTKHLRPGVLLKCIKYIYPENRFALNFI